MLKKVFKFKDLDGNEQEETFYFHLYEADLVKLQISVRGGMEGMLQQLIDTEDTAAIIAIFDDMISKSVGYKNERGKFVRTKQFAEEFMSSEQYSELFIEILGTPEKQIEFVKGIIPEKFTANINASLAGQTVLELPDQIEDSETGKELDQYSRDELLTMDKDLFDSLVGTDLNKMSHEHLQIAFQRKTAAQAMANAVNKQ